jgi:hypothetical protein
MDYKDCDEDPNDFVTDEDIYVPMPHRQKQQKRVKEETWRFEVMRNSKPTQTNMIRTSKYSLLSFLPLNLWN